MVSYLSGLHSKGAQSTLSALFKVHGKSKPEKWLPFHFKVFE